jgi:uncharacterized protein YycO
MKPTFQQQRAAARRMLISGALAASCTWAGSVAAAGLPADAVPAREVHHSLDGEACQRHVREHHGGASDAERAAAMERELNAYLQLSEEALGMRAKAIQLFNTITARTARGEALSGQDLLQLNEGAAALLRQRAALLDFALAHECWLDLPLPDDARAAAVHSTGVLMSLAAALTLYDNYASAISLYRDEPALRQHLNRRDNGFAIGAGELNRITLMFASPENRQRVRRAIHWYERQREREPSPQFEAYPYLVQLVEQSPSYHLVRRVRPLYVLGQQVDFFSALAIDAVFGLKDEGTHLSSLIFGNAVGLVETRRGKLDRRPDVLGRVASALRAGDILLEKTPFRLTDTFIPGHWGHAAIWVGGEAELRELGIWDHPVVQAHQARLRAGRAVVEALRSGVEMNPLERFLNIDDLAVLRHENLSAAQRAAVILQTLRQVGKAYDFNFDAETTDRVFCSKLVYLAYGDLRWPTSRILGRFTISPDNIAERATGDGPLTVALLFHDGNEVSDAPRNFMAQLARPQLVGQLRPAASR